MRRGERAVRILALMVATLVVASVMAQPPGEPLVSAFTLNADTAGTQSHPSLARRADGSFVAVWQSGVGQDGDGTGIFGRRFGPDGEAIADAFRVNTTVAGDQRHPAIAVAPDDRFVVTWQGPDDDGVGIWAQRFDAEGSAVGDEIALNAFTTSNQTLPAVAADSTGIFLVVWQSFGQDGSGFGIYGRLMFTDDTLGPETRFNVTTDQSQRHADVAGGPDGFVVAWEAVEPFPVPDDVFLRRVSSAGVLLTGEVEARQFQSPDEPQVQPSVAMDAAGNVTLVHGEVFFDGTSPLTSRYDGNLVAMAGVRSLGLGNAVAHDVASAPGGEFVVASAVGNAPSYAWPLWADRANAANESMVFGSRMLTWTMTDDGGSPAVAHLRADERAFVVAWTQRRDEKGNPSDVMAFIVRPNLFRDGFESGNTSAWTNTVP